jgi:hypothetical protein
MRTSSLSFTVLAALLVLPDGVLSAQVAGPPVTTGGTLSSKPWLHRALPATMVLPVVSGGTLSSKPWLGRQAPFPRSEQWVTRGGSRSSKPWLDNEWRWSRVRIGPLTPVKNQP